MTNHFFKMSLFLLLLVITTVVYSLFVLPQSNVISQNGSYLIYHNQANQYYLSSIINDGAVLQRDTEVPIFGSCYNHDKIDVILNELVFKTECLNNKWHLTLPQNTSGGPYSLIIKISGLEHFVHEIKNIFFGDVWIVSGQSNMSETSIFFNSTSNNVSLMKLSPFQKSATWTPLMNGMEMPSVASYFGNKLSEYKKLPIGLIVIAEGSTNISFWHPENKDSYYNKILKPFYPFNFKGVIWWQGETDAMMGTNYSKIRYIDRIRSLLHQWNIINFEKGGSLSLLTNQTYKNLFFSMILDWRNDTGKQFPFIFAQLQRYTHEDENWSQIRNVQQEALKLPLTAMIRTYDITDGDLHPQNKKQIAELFAEKAATF